MSHLNLPALGDALKELEFFERERTERFYVKLAIVLYDSGGESAQDPAGRSAIFGRPNRRSHRQPGSRSSAGSREENTRFVRIYTPSRRDV
jgi:hypothetical protein